MLKIAMKELRTLEDVQAVSTHDCHIMHPKRFLFEEDTYCEECAKAIKEYYPDAPLQILPRLTQEEDWSKKERCCQCSNQISPYLVLFADTTAPECYDGFGTQTGVTGLDGKRTVSILYQHREWQIQRYWSGMYLVELTSYKEETQC